jgi:hypothetical protein
MSMRYSVALVGDYNSSVPAHQAIPLALDLAAAYHGAPIRGTWVPTANIQDVESQFKTYQGIWCVPAGPYQIRKEPCRPSDLLVSRSFLFLEPVVASNMLCLSTHGMPWA